MAFHAVGAYACDAETLLYQQFIIVAHTAGLRCTAGCVVTRVKEYHHSIAEIIFQCNCIPILVLSFERRRFHFYL